MSLVFRLLILTAIVSRVVIIIVIFYILLQSHFSSITSNLIFSFFSGYEPYLPYQVYVYLLGFNILFFKLFLVAILTLRLILGTSPTFDLESQTLVKLVRDSLFGLFVFLFFYIFLYLL